MSNAKHNHASPIMKDSEHLEDVTNAKSEAGILSIEDDQHVAMQQMERHIVRQVCHDPQEHSGVVID
jgi:hypothetical protein